MTNSLRIVLAQLDFLVGDVEGNAKKIIDNIMTARDVHHADLVVFPELAISGYPPEDLLYRSDLHQSIAAVLPKICEHASDIDIILGYPFETEDGCYNRAGFIRNKQLVQYYDKQKLPNYSVFDEMRYFQPGPPTPCLVNIQGIEIAITICEDIWYPEPILQAKAAGAELVLSINASPFSKNKAALRQSKIMERIAESALPVLYLNSVGGQDELVFDGGSMAFNEAGIIVHQADFFKESLVVLDIKKDGGNPIEISTDSPTDPTEIKLLLMREEARIYNALVLGLHDYIEKNHFPSAVLGLSGGLDSALTLAIAVDAIGKDRVQAIMMPSPYNAEISLIDAKMQCEIMGVDYHVLPIESVFESFLETLQPIFQNLPVDTAEENLQARCRGTLLMAISNKKHAIVLATGNKSETAVGYSTLYGDMAGGFSVLKDVFKTMVYKLVQYRMSLSAVIPERVILRPPSAELAPNQKDSDFLPPYSLLDQILELYIERDESLHAMVQAGFDETLVRRIMQMVDRNEYKRRQAPPGIRITECAFGRDRRYPITSGFRPFLTA